ncbi:MAG TPA: guanitoxin biosynthesis heme-dependent pre-guanitoxin N-hydroxylase GntA [Pyrinomonadaceae bacterium]|nr:guanitoxin biosynthesis heme-dependent pre-guanitoxin N-hydroxylase GntA [Pyrinomonadaceae bacterium]
MIQAVRDTESPLQKNPFSDARAESAYAAWSRGRLIHPLEPARTPSALTLRVHDSFRAHVLAQGFSCVGGKAAINNNTYRFGFYAEMGAGATTAGLAHDLWEYVREWPSFQTEYATYIASFAAPVVSDEREWEQLLWSQLQSLYDLDRAHHAWDPRVSPDPADPDFSFSFAGMGFFVVGLHPASSRHARRFAWPTLVFNAHEQFERLREQNQFERLRETVRARDYKLQGSLNPNLSDFGEHSEARQYSGRAVEEGWRCPFRPRADGANESTS